MRAITIHQPWAHLIASGHKRIENRSWEYPESLRGCDMAIHAGKKWDAERIDLVSQTHGSCPERSDVVFGSIIAVARLGTIFTVGDLDAHEEHRKWFIGKYAWILEDVRRIEPIECRGFQKLWDLSSEQDLLVVRRLYKGARTITAQPQTQCPGCGAWVDDHDGFGVLAHTKPAYADGCGYCAHPSRDGTPGMCGICGDIESSNA